MYDQRLQKITFRVLFVWRFWKIPSQYLAVTRKLARPVCRLLHVVFPDFSNYFQFVIFSRLHVFELSCFPLKTSKLYCLHLQVKNPFLEQTGSGGAWQT